VQAHGIIGLSEQCAKMTPRAAEPLNTCSCS
jgi:hypothetical protein